MRVLYLTPHRVDDRSFGGAIRSNLIGTALRGLGRVDTIVVHGGPSHRFEDRWDDRRVRRIDVRHSGFGLRALPGRARTRRWIAEVVEEGGYDAIVARYFDLALMVPRRRRDRLVIDADDFTIAPLPGARRSAAARLKAGARSALARYIVRRARHVWHVSPAPEQSPPVERRSLLPNVVVGPGATARRARATPPRVLMVGTFRHGPNVEGLERFHRHVWPALAAAAPGIELHAVGAGSRELAAWSPGLVGHGFVDDLADHYAAAAVVIAPIVSGGGSQIKVLDALAHGCPVVGSPFAFAGFADALEDGEHLLVARSPDEWVAMIRHLVDNPQEADAMGSRGRRLVEERYGMARMEATIRATFAGMGLIGRA